MEKAKLSSTKKVLLVDDERNALVALAKILREDGYDVVVASTEDQAMNRLGRSAFDFIITNLFLLHSCCTRLLDMVKNLNPPTPVILTTGHGDVSRYVDESRLEGMTCLSKPIKYEELMRVLATTGSQDELE